MEYSRIDGGTMAESNDIYDDPYETFYDMLVSCKSYI